MATFQQILVIIFLSFTTYLPNAHALDTIGSAPSARVSREFSRYEILQSLIEDPSSYQEFLINADLMRPYLGYIANELGRLRYSNNKMAEDEIRWDWAARRAYFTRYERLEAHMIRIETLIFRAFAEDSIFKNFYDLRHTVQSATADYRNTYLFVEGDAPNDEFHSFNAANHEAMSLALVKLVDAFDLLCSYQRRLHQK